MQGSECRTENSSAVRRAAVGGRTAVAAGRIDNPRTMMDKELLFPGDSRQSAPAPGCRPQILSHSAFPFSAADCGGSAACASTAVSGSSPGGASSGPSRQISHSPFKASGNRKSEMAILRIIGKTPNLVARRGGCQAVSTEGYFFAGVVAGCEIPCLKCCSSAWLQISSPMSHAFSLNMRLAVKG